MTTKKKDIPVPAEFKNKPADERKELGNKIAQLVIKGQQESVVVAEIEPTKSVVKEKEQYPQGYVLCVAKLFDPKPLTYTIARDGKEYTFSAPDYTCALPKELAEKYDKGNHVISIL